MANKTYSPAAMRGFFMLFRGQNAFKIHVGIAVNRV
jgi:hypothetical protein